MAGKNWDVLESVLKPATTPGAKRHEGPRPGADQEGPSKVPPTPKSQGKKPVNRTRSPPHTADRSPKRAKHQERSSVLTKDDLPILSLEDLGQVEFERFKKKPMAVCASLCMGIDKIMDEMAGELQGARAEKEKALAEAQQRYDQLAKSKKEALKRGEDDRAKLSKRNKELADQVATLKTDLEVMEKKEADWGAEKAELEAKIQMVAQAGREAAIEQFYNALAQARALNPDLNINLDEKMIKPAHYVAENKIMLPEQVDEQGNIVRPATILF